MYEDWAATNISFNGTYSGDPVADLLLGVPNNGFTALGDPTLRHSLLCSFSLMTLSMLTAATPHSMAQSTNSPSDRWSAQKANDWYKQQPWLVGADFIPSNAINEFEMFQAATVGPAINDKELGIAESIGMNTVRVFLQDQLWQQDPEGLKQRLDTFLGIAASHHIKPLLVLFDSCWETNPKLGPQHPAYPWNP